jgi:hypothetical protein
MVSPERQTLIFEVHRGLKDPAPEGRKKPSSADSRFPESLRLFLNGGTRPELLTCRPSQYPASLKSA